MNAGNETKGLGERNGPLKGVTVLDITRVVAGPYCSMMFADLGATVIKMENPKDPDYTRTFPPMVGSEGEQISASSRNSIATSWEYTIDLKPMRGKELLRQLVRQADVLVENFRPGAMDKLGLGYESCATSNPRLVYTAMSGFGRNGPNRPSRL